MFDRHLAGPKRKQFLRVTASLGSDHESYDAILFKYEQESAAWRQRERAAKDETGANATGEAADQTMTVRNALISALCEIPARTLTGICVKAKLAKRFDDEELAQSIVEDLQALPA